jgi:transposase-like protein
VAEQLRADRDEAIRTAYNNGMAMQDIAAALSLSHQRVSQIIRS